jgi:glycogen debranching enzyme
MSNSNTDTVQFLHPGIRVQGRYCKKVRYDISNSIMMAGMDGCGSIIHFSIAHGPSLLVPHSFYSGFSADKRRLRAFDEKTVTMHGRRQILEVPDFFCLDQYIDQNSSCVVFRFTNITGTLTWDFGFLLESKEHPLTVACSAGTISLKEIEGKGYHYQFVLNNKEHPEESLFIIFSPDKLQSNKSAFTLGQRVFSETLSYERELASFSHNDNPLLHTLCAASLNAGISSYKETGEFAGFFAGIHYQYPARTYYRDSYFTVFPLHTIRPEWVHRQILTLVSGIDIEGDCPSAVQADGKAWWPKHEDSPLYLVLLIDDYIQATGDKAILSIDVNGKPVADWLLFIMKGIARKEDETALLYREEWNRHDWVDNIYRCGYVSYIQILYYRSLTIMDRYFPDNNFDKKAERVYHSFNRILWNEEKGWYVNYLSPDYCEGNLSIDTVPALLWGLVPEERRERFLCNLEQLLETRNNSGQPFGDWGVMSVFPPYQYPEHLVEKSMDEYCYHNGSEWPYWSAFYALVKKRLGKEYHYPLTRWFVLGTEQGWYTPFEYHNPLTGRGSLLQGWSAFAAALLMNEDH